VEDWECVEGCPIKLLDGQSGVLKSGAMKKPYEYTNTGFSLGKPTGKTKQIHESNQGGASRFFKTFEYEPFYYCAKASRREREEGLKGQIPCIKCGELDTDWHLDDKGNKVKCTRNGHPTVKPVKLMRYLCRLITPLGGTIADFFMGSGSTGVACVEENFNFIGVEKEKESFDIAEARIRASLSKEQKG